MSIVGESQTRVPVPGGDAFPNDENSSEVAPGMPRGERYQRESLDLAVQETRIRAGWSGRGIGKISYGCRRTRNSIRAMIIGGGHETEVERAPRLMGDRCGEGDDRRRRIQWSASRL